MRRGLQIGLTQMCVVGGQKSVMSRDWKMMQLVDVIVWSSTPNLPDFVHHLVACDPAHQACLDLTLKHDLALMIEIVLEQQLIVASKVLRVITVFTVISSELFLLSGQRHPFLNLLPHSINTHVDQALHSLRPPFPSLRCSKIDPTTVSTLALLGGPNILLGRPFGNGVVK